MARDINSGSFITEYQTTIAPHGLLAARMYAIVEAGRPDGGFPEIFRKET